MLYDDCLTYLTLAADICKLAGTHSGLVQHVLCILLSNNNRRMASGKSEPCCCVLE